MSIKRKGIFMKKKLVSNIFICIWCCYLVYFILKINHLLGGGETAMINQDTIISCITLFSVTATLLGNIFSVIYTYKKDGEKMNKIQTDLTEGTNGLNSRIENECKDLSDDHKEIIDNLKGGHYEIKEGIAKIYAFQEKEEAIRQEAAKHMPAELQLEDLVKKVFENNRQLRNDIDALQKELREKEHLIDQQKQLLQEKDEIINTRRRLAKKMMHNQNRSKNKHEYDRDDELER